MELSEFFDLLKNARKIEILRYQYKSILKKLEECNEEALNLKLNEVKRPPKEPDYSKLPVLEKYRAKKEYEMILRELDEENENIVASNKKFQLFQQQESIVYESYISDVKKLLESSDRALINLYADLKIPPHLQSLIAVDALYNMARHSCEMPDINLSYDEFYKLSFMGKLEPDLERAKIKGDRLYWTFQQTLVRELNFIDYEIERNIKSVKDIVNNHLVDYRYLTSSDYYRYKNPVVRVSVTKEEEYIKDLKRKYDKDLEFIHKYDKGYKQKSILWDF